MNECKLAYAVNMDTFERDFIGVVYDNYEIQELLNDYRRRYPKMRFMIVTETAYEWVDEND